MEVQNLHHQTLLQLIGIHLLKFYFRYFKNTDRYSAMAIGNAGSNLLRVDENGKNQPDLAEKVEVSEDGKTFTATLRDGIKMV